MALQMQWYGCDLQTGEVIEELPDLTPTGPLGRDLADHVSCSFTLPLVSGGSHGAPPAEWRAATEPGRTLLVAVASSAPDPVWCGIVLDRDGGSAPVATISAATPEVFLKRRRVTDHAWLAADGVAVVAAGLAGDATTEGVGWTVQATGSGTTIDRTYFANSDKSIHSALQELMDAGLLEWTVDVAWNVAGSSVDLTLRLASRIGIAAPAVGPTALYESGGRGDVRYSFRESWADADGATAVIATSVGQGDQRPESPPARANALIATGMPRWEFWYNPSSDVTDPDELALHAAQTLAVMQNGAQALQITSSADTSPVLGQVWNVGDDVGYDLHGPAHPAGLAGTARVVGWRLDTLKGTVTPTLILPEPP